ncbi:NLI interacting factor-like phosphatase-domain-containing protein [Dioszegia hungarica]|uniref:NLI interacting factor-like phosphatase-domain-containing protein n=1 Tax=Dioszegia hungarica TaxID=4972 RepID=A0AA38H1L3_9TREE|nr:NLI interacting factor-like phosphatase-domain-containing protein [Dioszegia hungarica]KAI9632045.1 NLI interacting factor-like phosphatase-domain-containing protein [Dioszegia hungarica]
MNTLSRVDALFTHLLEPSSSRTPMPPPTPLGLDKSTRIHTTSPSRPLSPFAVDFDSHLSPPVQRRRRSLKRRRKATSASSVKLPPPSTPFFLRIALGLWSILLSFWTSLVGETRAERGRRRTQKRRIGTKKAGMSSDDGSGTEVELLSVSGGVGVDVGGELGDVTETEGEDGDGWNGRVEEVQGMDLRVNPPTPERTYNLRSSNGSPAGILSNPLPGTSPSRARTSLTPTPPRGARLLPNPMNTSLLDPSVSLFSATLPPQLPPPPPRIRPHHTPFHLQKTLILDLDETLIHSTSRPLGYGTSGGGGMLGISLGGLLGGRKSRREGHTVEVVLRGRSTTYHVYKRPYVDHFLKKAASWYTLVIYTASMPEYADPVIDWLDAGRSLFAKRLYRDSCFLQTNGSYIKDLALVEQDLSRVCFMDNSPVSYAWNKANALPIEGWTSDPNDEALLQSLPVLDCLRFVNDVRRILGIRGFS